MTIDDDSENGSPIKRSSSPLKSKAICQSQLESHVSQKLKIDPVSQIKKSILPNNTYSSSQIPAAYRALYPVNVNVSPPGDEMLKQAHSTLHQDMIRMTKRFDFFMHKFLKLEQDLQEMKCNFEKVVDFSTKSMSRREKQALLSDLKQTSKSIKKKEGDGDEVNNNSLKCDPDDDEYDMLIKKEQIKLIQKQKEINTNIYTAEIDPNSRVDSFTQCRKQTQLEISTQLQRSTDIIDVPEILRKQRQSNGERKIKAKDLKEDSHDNFDENCRTKKQDEDLRLDPETMLGMLAEDDSKDQKEEEKEEKKRRKKSKDKSNDVKTQSHPAPRPFDEGKQGRWEDEDLEPDLPDEDITGINDEKIGLFDEDPDMIGADFDEDMD